MGFHQDCLVLDGHTDVPTRLWESPASLELTGGEVFTVRGIAEGLSTGKRLDVTASVNGSAKTFQAIARIDTPVELEYYRQGGILPFVLRRLR